MQDNNVEEWCQDHIWKKKFKGKCFKSKEISIPEAFLRYLSLDTVVVDLNDEDDECQQLLQSSSIALFIQEISDAIQFIGGNGVVPRLNWSCPK